MPARSTRPKPGSPDLVPCMEITEGEARYLLALRDLNMDGKPPSQAAVARKVGVSHPTALEMIRRLRALNLVAGEALTLTASGTSAALVLTSRRHAARVLAQEVLGLDDEQSAAEADALATSLSPVLARRLVAWRTRHAAGAGDTDDA
jgi:Mn-dependent DtxR family transcriptional regulator